MDFKIEKYNKDRSYSFTFGAFPTFELIKNKPEQVICLLLHSKLKISDDIQKLINICENKKLPQKILRQPIKIIYDSSQSLPTNR